MLHLRQSIKCGFLLRDLNRNFQCSGRRRHLRRKIVVCGWPVIWNRERCINQRGIVRAMSSEGACLRRMAVDVYLNRPR
jgi:hypothetical protein